jgi:hypothetical protein
VRWCAPVYIGVHQATLGYIGGAAVYIPIPHWRSGFDVPAKDSQRIPLDLNSNQELDLRAFCEVFYDAKKAVVIRRALAEFIDREVDRSGKREEFLLARRRLAGEPLRLISVTGGEKTSSGKKP